MTVYHNWEENRGLFDVLNDPEHDEAAHLNPGEEVHSFERYPSQIGQVGLVLLRHPEQKHAVEELEAVQRRHAHVEEDTVEHGHGDL